MRIDIDKDCNERIDKVLTKKFPQLSRSKIQEVIKAGGVKVNDNIVKSSYKLKFGDVVEIQLPEITRQVSLKSKIPLNVIYEDEDIIAVNKDYNVVSHPAGKYREGTLLQGIYNYLDEKGELQKFITPLFKPTLIHRLDKETSGVILTAKTLEAYYGIQKQFLNRTIYKEYWCIVEGYVRFDSDLIEKKIGKSKVRFSKMFITTDGKESQTVYKVQKRFKNFSLVTAMPKTGRTHQIRIHLSSIGYPVLCDKVYGRRKMLYKWQIENARLKIEDLRFKMEELGQQSMGNDTPLISRQALHAKRIQFVHPITNKQLTLEAELPNDFFQTLKYLEQYQKV